jgi:hypothetical protein
MAGHSIKCLVIWRYLHLFTNDVLERPLPNSHRKGLHGMSLLCLHSVFSYITSPTPPVVVPHELCVLKYLPQEQGSCDRKGLSAGGCDGHIPGKQECMLEYGGDRGQVKQMGLRVPGKGEGHHGPQQGFR